MILCAAEGNGGFAVTEGEEGGLFAVEEFFDNEGCRRRAELAGQHFVDFRFRFGAITDDHYAFAGGEAIGLDHVWGLQSVQEILGGRRLREGLRGGGRHIGLRAEVFGEGL